MQDRDIQVCDCELFFCPVQTRVPLKFGAETTFHVISARVKLTVTNGFQYSDGWGETPLSVAWVWPSGISFEYRSQKLQEFTRLLAAEWCECPYRGHSMEIGHLFIREKLKWIWEHFNAVLDNSKKMPWLAALVCNSLFDIALHDAYGSLHETSAWNTYNADFMNHDLSWYYTEEYATRFERMYPADFLLSDDKLVEKLPVWHLVGGKDAVTQSDLTGNEPDDGYPILLEDWIKTDGLRCLKIKLCGTDAEADYKRLTKVGSVASKNGVLWLTADFNCTVHDPDYVNAILDRLMTEQPRLYGMVLYLEQPFPYEIEKFPIDVHSISARKPLFMDESVHEWHNAAFGKHLGWTGVVLKTCKTLTGSLLTLCWAKKHGMPLMVQDLSNSMLAQIPHVALAARAGTIMGVESNAMQFYPVISADESRVHPGLYKRTNGMLDLSTLGKTGLGYRYNDIQNARDVESKDKWEKVV